MMYQEVELDLLPPNLRNSNLEARTYFQWEFQFLFPKIWSSGFLDCISSNQRIRVLNYEKFMDMTERKWCINCDGNWCTNHKCSNSYLVFFNPFDRDDETDEGENLELQEELVVVDDETFLDGDQLDQISEGEEEQGIEKEFKELTDCIMFAEKSEWVCSSDPRIEGDLGKIIEEEISTFEGLEVCDDKPEREVKEEFISSHEFQKTNSIGKSKRRVVRCSVYISLFDPVHYFQNDLAGVEHDFVKNVFGFYNCYKGKTVPACVHKCERYLEYKSKRKKVIQMYIICCAIKKNLRKLSRFQFDPGGNRVYKVAELRAIWFSMRILICLLTTLFAIDFFEIKASQEIAHVLKKQLVISTILMTVGIAVVSLVVLRSTFLTCNFGTQKVGKNWEFFLCVSIELWVVLIIGMFGFETLTNFALVVDLVKEKNLSIENARKTIKAVIEDCIVVSCGWAQCKFICGLLQMGKECGTLVVINLENCHEFVSNLLNLAYASHTNCPENYTKGSPRKQLALSNKSLGGGVTVILAERDKEERMMDIEKLEFDFMGTSVIRRSGSPCILPVLRMISASNVSSIINLAFNENADQSDVRAPRVVLSLAGIKERLQGHAVVKLSVLDDESLVELVDSELVETVVARDVIGPSMIECALQHGFEHIWEGILGFENAEFYIKRWPDLDGLGCIPSIDLVLSLSIFYLGTAIYRHKVSKTKSPSGYLFRFLKAVIDHVHGFDSHLEDKVFFETVGIVTYQRGWIVIIRH